MPSDSEVLRIGPLDPSVAVEPGDPDTAGKLVGRFGSHNKARALIAAVAANNPPALVKAGALVLDPDRTKAVRENLDEVVAAAETEDPIESATVRGAPGGAQIVLYVARAPSGRSYRGFVPYSKGKGLGGFSRTEADAERYRDERLGLERAIKAARGDDVSDPALDEVRAENARLRAELEAAQNGGGAPDGYDGLGVDDIKANLDEADAAEVQAVLDWERAQKKPRKGVTEAADARLKDLAEAG